MAGNLRSCRPRAGVKRSSDDLYRNENHPENDCNQERFFESGFGHHIPVLVKTTSNGINLPKQPRSSSYSDAQGRKPLPKSKPRISCSSFRGPHLRMEELQCIKRELKVIKNQIDDLLNSLELMDVLNRGSSEEGVFSHCQRCSTIGGTEGSQIYQSIQRETDL